ncbi:MAG: AmmeMemoRadiSam system radical SAM enzyme [Nitrospirae bacterium]|nr:AmmeMemoRadiSam system radical SAM enzyme [Nitrospirota bacterium]
MGDKVRCELCPTECELDNYQIGGCRTRINKSGVLYSLVYGKPCSVAIDPIEKKPFYHFLPATAAFSIATAGCVLDCKFCQNYQISQARPEEVDHKDLPPADVVRQALYYGCRSITYTYTEPTVFYEYMFDTAKLARDFKLKNTMHTCGYINSRPLRELAPFMDAADVDLKAFTEDFYSRICGGRLRPVLDTLVELKKAGVWIEITNLVIPTLNDDIKKISEMTAWIVNNLGRDVPLHFSRFFPYYKLKNLPPTPPGTLSDARKAALDSGLRYVYIGNLAGGGQNTSCHKCGRLLVERSGFRVNQNNIINGRCGSCGTGIPGVWG